MEKEILQLIGDKKCTRREVLQHFSDIQNKKINKILNKLEDECIISTDKYGYLFTSVSSNFFVTNIKESTKGKPYIINEDGIKVSLKYHNMLGSLPGDKVCISMYNNEGIVKEIVDRSETIFVIEVSVVNGIKRYTPLNSQVEYNIVINKEDAKELVDGDRVLITPDCDTINNTVYAKVKKVLCNKKDANAEAISIAAEKGFRYSFDEKSLEELKSIKEEVTEEDIKDRKDLRDELVLTIDPITAKDLDDAFSLEKTEYGYLLKTHIADVANYVEFGSHLYNDALLNCFSIYLANEVIPMLPHKLSSGICSLHEDVDRLVRTTEIKLDNEGNVIDYKIYKSVIRSRKKMDYHSVSQIYDGESVQGYEEYEKLLLITKELTLKLNKLKYERGFLKFKSNELEFKYDEKGIITDITEPKDHLSHEFIENIMVLTNNLRMMSFGTLPTLYRNHPMPEKSKIEEALKKLKDLDFHSPELYETNPLIYLQKVLAKLSTKDEFLVLSKVILTSFERASYGVNNVGHFGLSLDVYSHTTSPIRRIVDYLIQYLEDFYQRENITNEDIENIEKLLIEVAPIANEKERAAKAVEYKSNLIENAKFLEPKVGELFEVLISDFTPTSIVIAQNGLLEGKIHINSYEHKHLYYDPTTYCVRDKDKNRYKIGHTLLVRLKSVNTFNGDMEYILIENMTIKNIKDKKSENKVKTKINNPN